MFALLLAFIADLFIGDPVYPYHPARLMGRGIEWGESFLRKTLRDERLGGTLLALCFPAFVFCLVWSFIFILTKIHFVLGWVAACFGIYSSISVHDLRKEAVRIYKDLKENNLEAARQDVARIVGRETAHLNEGEIARACIESVAENSVDGIVAPLFYAALGGAPLALAYKAVNTLDSMIGHNNERYRIFGFFAAKQDDLINWLPARLSYGLIGLASVFVTPPRAKEAFQVGWPYAMTPSYGNSPIPEATFAGALGVRLGGENLYHGKIMQTPLLGTPLEPLRAETIPKALGLMMAMAWTTLFFCLMISGIHHL